MTAEATEKRLSELEKRLDAVQNLINERLPVQENSPLAPKEKRGWQAIVGTFSEDPEYDEAMRLGRAWRDGQQNQRASESN